MKNGIKKARPLYVPLFLALDMGGNKGRKLDFSAPIGGSAPGGWEFLSESGRSSQVK